MFSDLPSYANLTILDGPLIQGITFRYLHILSVRNKISHLPLTVTNDDLIEDHPS